MPDSSPPKGKVSLERMRNSTDQILSNENYIDVKGTVGLLHLLFYYNYFLILLHSDLQVLTSHFTCYMLVLLKGL